MPILEKIVVSNFRNIEFQEIMFSPNVNCISGNNGEGKTNLLDAIYYLSMTKSAFSTSDRYVFRYGTDSFSIGGTYIMESRSGEEPLRARFSIYVGSGGEKKFKKDETCRPAFPEGRSFRCVAGERIRRGAQEIHKLGALADGQGIPQLGAAVQQASVAA